jgi:hypothetical protein
MKIRRPVEIRQDTLYEIISKFMILIFFGYAIIAYTKKRVFNSFGVSFWFRFRHHTM